MKTVLITGVNGFVGPYLAQELHKRGLEVIGTGIDTSLNDSATSFIASYISADLTDREEAKKLPWKEIDGVIHLAGLSAVGPSFNSPSKYMLVNTSVITEQFEACITADVRPRFVLISSGAVYDSSSKPISEESRTNVSSPYVVSKLSAELLTKYYSNSRSFQAVTLRPFNHIGPGQMGGFIVPDFIAQARKVLSGKQTSIKVGNLETKRDYTDVRDVVSAYADTLLAPDLSYDTYNVCSGKSISGEELLHTLLEIMGQPHINIEKDEKLFRPSDNPIVTGSFARLHNEVGWEPRISLEQTIKDIVT